MANEKIGALSILTLIIGAIGIGAGGFAIYQNITIEGPQGPSGEDGADGIDGTNGINGVDGDNGIDGSNGTVDNLVAIWNQGYVSGIEFNISLVVPIYNSTEHLYMPNSVEMMLDQGWYRFSIVCYVVEYEIAAYYSIQILKNDVTDAHLAYVEGSDSHHTHFVNSVGYVYSDGDDVFRLFGATGSSSGFSVDVKSVVLEFLGE